MAISGQQAMTRGSVCPDAWVPICQLGIGVAAYGRTAASRLWSIQPASLTPPSHETQVTWLHWSPTAPGSQTLGSARTLTLEQSCTLFLAWAHSLTLMQTRMSSLVQTRTSSLVSSHTSNFAQTLFCLMLGHASFNLMLA